MTTYRNVFPPDVEKFAVSFPVAGDGLLRVEDENGVRWIEPERENAGKSDDV